MQAINLYGERPYLQPGLPEARDFAQATEHSKQLTNAYRADIQKLWDELENARRKLQVLFMLPRDSCPNMCLCMSPSAQITSGSNAEGKTVWQS